MQGQILQWGLEKPTPVQKVEAPTIEHEFLARNTRAALTSVPGPPLAPLHAAARLLRRHSRVLYLPCMHISLSGT